MRTMRMVFAPNFLILDSTYTLRALPFLFLEVCLFFYRTIGLTGGVGLDEERRHHVCAYDGDVASGPSIWNRILTDNVE